MYYVYALVSNKRKRIYVGLTGDLKSRIREHNLGKTKSTKYYKPWTLLYFEKLNTRVAARNREKKLKSGYGKEFLKNLVYKKSEIENGPVAQLDRASAF